jgi:hypothetical protein
VLAGGVVTRNKREVGGGGEEKLDLGGTEREREIAHKQLKGWRLHSAAFGRYVPLMNT